jgi:hypothetical protein
MMLASLVTALAVLGLALAKPEQIRSDQDPVFHLYLQKYPKNSVSLGNSSPRICGTDTEADTLVVLGPQSTSEYFNINGSIQSTNSSLYLNIGADSTSYKTLTFDKTASTTVWGLEGDTIITTKASSYGRQLNFVACKLDGGFWQMYFQTGSAVPSGKQCSNFQSLHLPCLC